MRRLLFLALFYCIIAALKAQPVVEQESIRLLKQQLPHNQGLARLNILKQIVNDYNGAYPIQPDSSLRYARDGLLLAHTLRLQRLECMAAISCGSASLQLSKASQGLVYYRQALQLARETRNDTSQAIALRGIGQARWYKADFLPAIDTVQLAITYFEKAGIKNTLPEVTLTVSNIYGDQGNYEKAFEWAQKAYIISSNGGFDPIALLALIELGKLYKNIGDYTTAQEYYAKSRRLSRDKMAWSYRYLSGCIGDLYLAQQRYDSAAYFYHESFSGHAQSKTARLKMAGYYFATGRYDSSLACYEDLHRELEGSGESYIYVTSLLGISKIHLQYRRYRQAIDFATKALALAQQKDARIHIRDASYQLYLINEAIHRPAQAFAFYKLYVQTQDAIISNQFKGKLYEFRRIAENEKQEARITLLQREKQLDQQELQQNRLLRNTLLGSLIALSVLSVSVVWSITLKRKNEKLKNEAIQTTLHQRAIELEMQALRAQMNPHFIFNCLSSINRYILKHEPDAASDYLTRFSRLIRMTLIHSQQQLITLEEEIEILRLYIEMEQLRFQHAFSYHITISDPIQPAHILLPPLLLQPFCENAIWHGLMHRQEPGALSISFYEKDDALYCTITDNGIGRAKAQELQGQSPEKIKSLGLQLTSERLALFNEGSALHTFYTIEDITDKAGQIQGTRVTLKIRNQINSQRPAI